MSERLLGRRSCLAAGLAAPLIGVSTGCGLAEPKFSANPFTLGIASGDPAPDGVVLWTRLATDPLHGGGLPPETSRPQMPPVHAMYAQAQNFLAAIHGERAPTCDAARAHRDLVLARDYLRPLQSR